MTTFVFRNQTIEPFLGYDGMAYSGYGDISQVPQDVDRYIWFYQVPVNADAAQLAQEVMSYCDQLDYVIAQADERKPFVIFSMVDLFPLRLTGSEHAVADAVVAFNNHARQLAAANSNVRWVDFGEFTSRYASSDLVNWKFYHLSQSFLNTKLAHDYQAWLLRI